MKDFFSLQGKIAVVTGAGRGLGQGIALRLAAAGATVGVNDLDALACKRVVERIVKDDGRAFAMPGNVVDETTMTNLFGFVHTDFGGVDILVNNAGVSVSEDIFEMSIENWRNVLDINLLGAVIGSKLALEQMRISSKYSNQFISEFSYDEFSNTSMSLNLSNAKFHVSTPFS